MLSLRMGVMNVQMRPAWAQLLVKGMVPRAGTEPSTLGAHVTESTRAKRGWTGARRQ